MPRRPLIPPFHLLSFAGDGVWGDFTLSRSRLTTLRVPGGPTFVAIPDQSAPVVSLQIWLSVGSVRECEADQGLSHFLEHMIFKGSRRLALGELASLVERAGGDVNAYTMSEATYYDLVCLPKEAERCLDILAEALWWPLLDAREIARERSVVDAEIRRNDEQPDQVLQQRLYREAYGQGHPFGLPILGTRKSVRSFDRALIRCFHRRFYHPAGAVAVAAGPVEPERLAKLLARKARACRAVFGKKAPSPVQVPDSLPGRSGPRVFILKGRSGLAQLELAYAVPPFTHVDAPALEAAMMILGSGESSRLYTALCKRQHLMLDVSSDVFYAAGPGLLFLGGMCRPDRVERSAEAIVREVGFFLGDTPPSAEELERVKVGFLVANEFRRESVRGRAQSAGYAQLLTGRADLSESYRRRVMALTPEAVREAAARYLQPKGLTAGAFLPDMARVAVDRRTLRVAILRGLTSGRVRTVSAREPRSSRSLPALALRSPRRIREYHPHEYRLPGGGTLFVVPGGAASVVSMRALFLGGQRLEGDGEAGLHGMMANVAAMAGGGLSSDEQARAVENLGASLSGFAGRNSFGLSAAGLAARFNEIAELFVGNLLAPNFDPSDIALVRRETLAERKSEQDDLGRYTRQKAMALLYGRHPYGRHPLGSRLTLGQMDRGLLRREWRRRAASHRLVLAVAGDVDPGDAARRLRRLLKTWPKAARPWRVPEPDAPCTLTRPRFRRYVLKAAQQSHLLVAYLGATFLDARRFPLSVAASLLGSQGGGLFWELRERRGLAYEMGVSSQEGIDPGPFILYAAVQPGTEAEAIRLVRAEVARLRDGDLSPDELDRAKAFLVGDIARDFQRAGARASNVAFNRLYGVDWKPVRELQAQIEAVNAIAVRRAARELLTPEKECLCCVGPATLSKLSRNGT